MDSKKLWFIYSHVVWYAVDESGSSKVNTYSDKRTTELARKN